MKKESAHIPYGELVAAVVILLLAAVAIAQSNSSNSSIILQDFQVEQFPAQTQLQPLQWLTVIDLACGSCEEGRNTTFTVKVTSLSDRPFTLNSILLADTDNIVFGGIQANSELEPNQTEAFEIAAPLPPATRGRTLYYVPCFSVTDSAGGEAQQSCERAPRRLMLSGFSVESMVVSLYILLAIVLLAIAVVYFALSSKLGDSEPEEQVAEEQPSQQESQQPL